MPFQRHRAFSIFLVENTFFNIIYALQWNDGDLSHFLMLYAHCD